MSAAEKLDLLMTREEYAVFEAGADRRHEFFQGTVVAMAGGSEGHSLLTANVIRRLGNAFDARPCRVYDSNMRVRIESTGLETYPDASVVCGPSKFADLSRQALLNPVMLMEVLSPGTEDYDRGKKFWHYRHLESLKIYVLVSQSEPLVEVFIRRTGNDAEWLLRTFQGIDSVMKLDPLDVSIPLRDIYAKTSVEGAETEAV